MKFNTEDGDDFSECESSFNMDSNHDTGGLVKKGVITSSSRLPMTGVSLERIIITQKEAIQQLSA